jgi:hypothetical protein
MWMCFALICHCPAATDSLPALRWPPPTPAAAKPSTPRTVRPLPANFYLQHLAPTCVLEKKVQKASGINLFFRLGDLQTVDRLEGKRKD